MKYSGFVLIALALSGCAAGSGGWVSTREISEASGFGYCAEGKFPADVINAGLGPVLRPSVPDGLYPGRPVYASINGQQWSGIEKIRIDQELANALMSGGTLHLSWSPWPWGGREETSVSLEGFRGECL